MSDTEFVRHMPCNHCGSSDANSLYSDGSTFCFKCHAYSHGDNDVIHNHRVSNVRLQGSAGRLHSRGISEKTAELFKTYKDGKVLRHYYYDNTGTLVGAKVRTTDKQFKCEGEVKTLYGMHLFKHKTTTKKKKLVIVEGEMDAMSVWEAQPNWDVVSIPNGAPAAKKAIQNNYECLVGENEQLQNSLRKQKYKNALLLEENKKAKKFSIIQLIFNKSEIGENRLIRGNNEGVIHGSAMNTSQPSKQLEVTHSDKEALFPKIVLRRLLNLARRKVQ